MTEIEQLIADLLAHVQGKGTVSITANNEYGITSYLVQIVDERSEGERPGAAGLNLTGTLRLVLWRAKVSHPGAKT
jgi:hypothetical protein